MQSGCGRILQPSPKAKAGQWVCGGPLTLNQKVGRARQRPPALTGPPVAVAVCAEIIVGKPSVAEGRRANKALGIVALIGVAAFTISACGDDEVTTIEGRTAHIRIVANEFWSVPMAASSAATAVWRTTTEHREITAAYVSVEVDGRGITDKYGNPVTGNVALGQIQITDVDEVRRYRDVISYLMAEKSSYTRRIVEMPGSHLLHGSQ